MKPLISVIVPIYKVEKYLETCVMSLIHQTYENLEIILVDDGSPDKCPEICDAYEKKDDRIRVIHKENGGLSDARNAALEKTTGKYITFVDSDDYVDAEYIEKLYNALIQYNASAAICGIRITDESRTVTDQIAVTEHAESEVYKGTDIIKKELQGEWVLVTSWGALFRADIFKKLRFPVGRHYEDEYVFCEIYDDLEQIVCIPDNMYFYLQRVDSIMGVTYKKQDCIDYLDMWHERITFYEKRERSKLLPAVIQSCLAWNTLYIATNAKYMEDTEKRMLKSDIRKYFRLIFKKPYLTGFGDSVKLAAKCILALLNENVLGKRYV
mgnify:FL=1